MNNSTSLSNKKVIEEFIKKSTLVILNSRIQKETTNEQTEDSSKEKINTSLLLDQRENDELDDIFLEDYSELLSYKNQLNTYTIELYFKRKEFSVLIERWTLQYLQPIEDWEVNSFIDNDYIKKKLIVMLRSVYSMSRFLPAYSLCNKKGFNYSIEYRLFLSIKNQNHFPNVHTSKIKIANADISNVSINVEYINRSDVFQLEEEYHKKTLEYLISNRIKHQQRPRCFSLTNPTNNPLFEVMTFDSSEQMINEDYFSDKRKGKNSKFNLNLSNALSGIKYVNDYSFQSETETDNPMSYQHYVNTEPTSTDIEINLTNELCMRKCSMLSDTADRFSNWKGNKGNEEEKTNTNGNDSTANKKLMKTSDTSSEFESENSFELEIEDDGNEVKDRDRDKGREDNELIVNKIDEGNKPYGNNNYNTEEVLNCYNKLKKALKTKTRLNTYKLCDLYATVLKTEY